jgi:hypothetical protein
MISLLLHGRTKNTNAHGEKVLQHPRKLACVLNGLALVSEKKIYMQERGFSQKITYLCQPFGQRQHTREQIYI